MGQYGEAAVRAVQLIEVGEATNPIQAWKYATRELIGSPSSRDKGCPRDAFLGLCEEGWVKNVKKGEYTSSKNNKKYAINMARLLCTNMDSFSKQSLWDQVMQEEGTPRKKENGQADVVWTLWENDLINCSR